MLPNEITLHIGVHKTATTFIQRSLKSLRGQMRGQGVAYIDRLEIAKLPSLRGWRAFRDPNDATPEMRPDMPAFLTHAPDLADGFGAELRKLAIKRCKGVRAATGSPPRHMLISSETLVGSEAPDFGPIYRPRAEAAIEHVLSTLEPQRVNLLIYIRRQDTLIESQYMQRIHDGEVHSFADFGRRATAAPYIRYGNLIERLRSLSSVAKVRVKPYEIIGAGSWPFIADLMAPLDLEIDLSAIGEGRANPRFTEPALQAALAINPLIDTVEQLRLSRRFLRSAFPATEYPAPQLFTPDQRRAVLEMYEPLNREFFRNYLPDAPEDAYCSEAGTDELRSLLAG